MGSIEIIHQTAVTGLEGRLLESLAFDGHYLYSLLEADRLAVRLDDSGEIRQRYNLRRRYCGLCADPSGGFWAVSRESPLYIFRLSDDMEEYDRIRIIGRVTAPPSLIDFDTVKQQLVIRADRFLMWISLTGDVVNCLPAPSQVADLSVFGHHLLTAGRQLSLYNEYLGFLEGFALPDSLMVTGATVLCRLPDRLLCSAICTRSGRYNTLFQLAMSPKAALVTAEELAAGACVSTTQPAAEETRQQLTPFFPSDSQMMEHILLALIGTGRQER